MHAIYVTLRGPMGHRGKKGAGTRIIAIESSEGWAETLVWQSFKAKPTERERA